MELSSPRFKATAVSTGASFWFIVVTFSFGVFSIELSAIFIISIFVTLQILSKKVSKALDIFAMFNTKIFLGILFIFVISVYGLLFKLLRIDLLRTKNNKDSYWLNIEQLKKERIFKQY